MHYFGDYVIWRDSFAELNSVYAARVHNRVFPIPLVKDVGVVAFATIEIVVASAANQAIVASASVEAVVAGAAVKDIVAFAAMNLVITVIAVEEVVGYTANYGVIAAKTMESNSCVVKSEQVICFNCTINVMRLVVDSFQVPNSSVCKSDFFNLVLWHLLMLVAP